MRTTLKQFGRKSFLILRSVFATKKNAHWFDRNNFVGNMGLRQKVVMSHDVLFYQNLRDEKWKWIDSDSRSLEYKYELVSKIMTTIAAKI